MNLVWTAMIAIGVAYAALHGGAGARLVTAALTEGAEHAVSFAFALIGLLSFWSGMLKLADEAGWTAALSRLLAPAVRWLFPSVPKEHPASASIVMALGANLLGLGNAATPLGLRAMKDLAELNPVKGVASDAMCTFLALSTSSVTLIPGTVIAVRAAAGSADPGAVVAATFVATTASTLVAVVLDRLFLRRGGNGR